MSQRFTSSNTSINKKRLPMVYNAIDFPVGSTILDYGCGKYIDHIKVHVESQGCTYVPYDKYNLDGSELPSKRVNIGVCSNVLNVIDSEDVIRGIIEDLYSHCEVAYITVYEGDKSGIGKQTSSDSWQRNERLQSYIDLIVSCGHIAEKVKGKNVIKIYMRG